MSEDLNRDDRAILLALARVMASAGTETPLPALADQTRVREYIEVLGLLPYGLEPEAPRPETKVRLLSQIGAPATAAESVQATPVQAGPPRGFDEVTLASDSEEDLIDVTFRRLVEPSKERAPAPAAESPAAVTPIPEPAIPQPAVQEDPTNETATNETPAVPAAGESAWRSPVASPAPHEPISPPLADAPPAAAAPPPAAPEPEARTYEFANLSFGVVTPPEPEATPAPLDPWPETTAEPGRLTSGPAEEPPVPWRGRKSGAATAGPTLLPRCSPFASSV